jgi:gluconokinase
VRDDRLVRGNEAGSVREDDALRVLVLDVGSSSARCWLFDRDGHGADPGGESRVTYGWETAGGAMERDPASLLRQVVKVVDAGVARARAEGWEIAAVAVTTFWHSLMGIDDDGRPVTPLTGWGDSRAGSVVSEVGERVDAAALHRRTGCYLDPSYPLVRLIWLRQEQPALFARVARWVSFGEFLERELFGELRCSFSMASGSGLLDVRRLRWDEEALGLAGLDPSRLAPLVDADEVLTGLRAPYSDRWPELATVPWYPPLGDGGCANLGSGAVGAERLGITVGTTAAVRVLVHDHPAFTVPDELWAYRLDRRRWVVGRAFSNGGNALTFLNGTLSPGSIDLDRVLRSGVGEDHGLTVIPFLVGERGPGLGRDAGGALLGLRLHTTPEQIARAWIEAICYRIAGVCGLLERHFDARGTPRASGGALHASPAWLQVLCDVLGRPVIRPAEREETSRGAALMALESLGIVASADVAVPGAAAEFRPRADRHRWHQAAMRRQIEVERVLGEGDPRRRAAGLNDP